MCAKYFMCSILSGKPIFFQETGGLGVFLYAGKKSAREWGD